MRLCEVCGADLTGRPTKTRFCGVNCRVKAHRSPATVTVPESSGSTRGSLTTVTLSELARVGRDGTPDGVHALLLAERMDSHKETGAAMASLSKQYDVIFAKAMANVKAAADPADELMAQRVKRAAG